MTVPPVCWAAATRASVVESDAQAHATTINCELFPAASAEMNSDTSGSLALFSWQIQNIQHEKHKILEFVE